MRRANAASSASGRRAEVVAGEDNCFQGRIQPGGPEPWGILYDEFLLDVAASFLATNVALRGSW